MVIGLGMMISAAGSIYSGVTSLRAADKQADDLEAQGEIVFSEAMRTANIIEEEGRKFAAGQSLQYIGSGVQIAGSALVTISQTVKYAETEAAAVRARGAAGLGLASAEASTVRSSGRADLVSGVLGAASSIIPKE